MNNYPQRYAAGEHTVWNEIFSRAPEVAHNSELHAEAVAVASMIMKRVESNVAAVRQTLKNAGATLRSGSVQSTDDDVSFLTKRFGALPLALDVFYKSIGSVFLTPVDYDYGDNALENRYGISLITLDPLMIVPISASKWALDEYDAEFTEEEEEDNPFGLFLSPDFLHKADISGGSPYAIYIPASTPENKLDPLVNFDDMPAMPFVEYLRFCFKWGGFPGLAALEVEDDKIDLNRKMPFKQTKGDWRAAARSLLAELRENVVAF